jgi:hypothetical protein
VNNFLVGFIFGAGVFAALIASIPASYHRQAKDAKEACEQTLPRDQACKITAIPVDKDQK